MIGSVFRSAEFAVAFWPVRKQVVHVIYDVPIDWDQVVVQLAEFVEQNAGLQSRLPLSTLLVPTHALNNNWQSIVLNAATKIYAYRNSV